MTESVSMRGSPDLLLQKHRGSGRPVASLWANRKLIAQLVRRELATRYADSVFGLVWACIQPVMSLAVYSVVFLLIFTPRAAGEGTGPTRYVMELFCGIVLFGVFSETVQRAPQVIVSKPSLVKKIRFPVELLPVEAFGTAAVLGLPGLAILLIALLAVEGRVSTTAWLFPLALVPMSLFVLGLGWFLSSLGVYLRDTGHFVRVALHFGIFLTPVVWSLDLLPADWMRTVVMLNPMAVVIETARDTLIRGDQPRWVWLGISTAVGGLVFAAGRWWFARTRDGMGDVV